jgi:hypothetical protein
MMQVVLKDAAPHGTMSYAELNEVLNAGLFFLSEAISCVPRLKDAMDAAKKVSVLLQNLVMTTWTENHGPQEISPHKA